MASGGFDDRFRDEENRYSEGRGQRGDDDGDPTPSRELAKKKVAAPAILLIIHAGFALLGSVYGIVSVQFQDPKADFQKQRLEQENDPKLTAAQKEQIKGINDSVEKFLDLYIQALPVLTGLSVVASLLMLIAGFKLYGLSSPGLVYLGALLALIPIFGCCCLGVVAGIWSLIVLQNQEVKSAMRLAR